MAQIKMEHFYHQLNIKATNATGNVFNMQSIRMVLLDGTVPSTNTLLDGTVPSTSSLFDRSVLSTNYLLDGAVVITCPVVRLMKSSLTDFYRSEKINTIK